MKIGDSVFFVKQQKRVVIVSEATPYCWQKAFIVSDDQGWKMIATISSLRAINEKD